MCVSAITMIVGAALSATSSLMGAAASSAAAQSEADWRQYQLSVQNKQLRDEQDMIRLNAQKTENDRLEMRRRQKATNEAFLAASGVDESISFLEGADPYNERVTRQDIATLRLNSASATSRIADQIAVNRAEMTFGQQKARMTSQASWIRGFGDAAGSMIKAYNSYDMWRR